MPLEHRRLAGSLTVGAMCAAAAFATLAVNVGPLPQAKGKLNPTTTVQQTTSVQTAPCPAGTVETRDACLVVKQAPRPVADVTSAVPVVGEPVAADVPASQVPAPEPVATTASHPTYQASDGEGQDSEH